jgi:hypothetical protein
MMGYDEGSKVTRLAHLKQVEKTRGRKPKQLEDMPKLPEDGAHIWAIFSEVKTMGVDLTYAELSAYQEITGTPINAFESSVLRNIDRLYKAAFNG